jgi:hypothetical protein
MRNRALHRRLAAVEAKSDEADKAIEREHRLAEERSISAEEAERAYRRLMASDPRTEGSGKLSLTK